MTQDYLIVRFSGLFDRDRRVVSFENLCPKDNDYLNIKKEPISEYLIDLRHNFAAHTNITRVQNSIFPETEKIINSNLQDVLQKLVLLADKY